MTETLLDLFVPPEGTTGHSAALVAMTGAEDFLEAAMQRFSGLRPRQRAELGNVLVYLMLDGHASLPRQHVFSPGSIPGLHEFQPRAAALSLLHAKIALLAFASSRTADPCHLRLAVLTANFTYTSARQRLELVWTIDVPLDGTANAIDRLEVAAAGNFLEQLLERRFYLDERELPSKQRALTGRLETLLTTAAAVAPANGKPRFIHSLDRSLYEQIRQRFRSAIHSRWNILLCGSGFYEAPTNNAGKPEVFAKLEELGGFTSTARRVALVEPDMAGAVAAWAREGAMEGWELVRPSDALGLNRRLHAKFLYAGYLRDGHVTNGSLYLGSGNLSRRGLLTNGTMTEGNVETGVVFDVNERLNSEQIDGALFWSRGIEVIGDSEWSVGQVGDGPETHALIETPPVLSALIEPLPERWLRLLWRDDVPNDSCVSIRWSGRDWFAAIRNRRVILEDGDVPTALRVRNDRTAQEWLVPIVDPAGRVCWQPPRFTTYSEALAALLDFPMRPAEAADEEDDADDPRTRGPHLRTSGDVADEKSYALHAAAELIENVAALQIALPASMLGDWLEHLDRIFHGSFPTTLIATWREHRIDIFSHLREPELRPSQLSDVQRILYFSVLDAAARSWGLR